MSSTAGLSLILPIHDEVAALEKALPAWKKALQKLDRPTELVLVLDGASPEVRSAVDALLLKFPEVRVLSHAEHGGYGASLRTALAETKFPLIAWSGCDFPYEPAELKPLLDRLEEVLPETEQKIDLVNGFRSGYPAPRWRQIAGQCWRSFLNIALNIPSQVPPGWLGTAQNRYWLRCRMTFGIRIQDINSRFKLVRRKLLDHIEIQSDGEAVHAEILAKLNFLGALMDELPITAGVKKLPPDVAAVPGPKVGRELRKVFRHPKFVRPLDTYPTPLPPETPPLATAAGIP